MSQAGGPNSAGSVNIDFTGNVAPVEQAAKKAEAVVSQSAANMQATMSSVTWTMNNMGQSYGGGISGAGIGGGSGSSPAAASKSTASGLLGIGTAAKDALRPVMSLIQAFSQFTLVTGLAVGAAVGVYQWFTANARAAKELAKEVDSVGDSVEKALSKFDYVGTSLEARYKKEMDDALAIYMEGYKKVDELRANRKGPLGSTEDIESIKLRFKKAKELEDRLGKELAEAQNQIKLKYQDIEYDEWVKNEEKKREVLERELKARLEKEREYAKRVRDLWQDVRNQQVSGTEVQGFAAGNFSQSLDLLNRQRSAVQGMSINYGGN